MSDPPSELAFECDECGYALGGLSKPGSAVRCPECGRLHAWPPPLARRAWPGSARLAAGMCGPCAGLWVLVAVVASIPALRIALAVMSSVLFFAWICSLMVPPAFVAGECARHCTLRPRRRMVAIPLALAGLGANIAISLVGLWITLRIWG